MRSIWIAVLCVLAAGTAHAQAPADAAPPPPAFTQLFPQPTGENGYEEIVQAGDLIKGNKALEAATTTGATLATKRKAMADRDVVRALRLLRLGLNKPIVRSPRTAITVSTLYPEMSGTRALARLLNVEQYVLLADGRISAAIDSLRDGLRLGNLMKSEALIGGLVGTAIDSIVLVRLSRHIEQLSARDCDRLISVLQAYLGTPDPAIAALESERRMSLGVADDLTRNLDKFADEMNTVETEASEPDPATVSLKNQLLAMKDDTGARAALHTEMIRRINTHFDAMIARLYDPTKPPATSPAATNDSVADRLSALFLPAYTLTRFTQIRVEAQILAVHAAIRRYRWETEKLPATLDALALGKWAMDPYTNQPLAYAKTSETTYTLSSVGPPAIDDDGNPIPGKRQQIEFPRPVKPQ